MHGIICVYTTEWIVAPGVLTEDVTDTVSLASESWDPNRTLVINENYCLLCFHMAVLAANICSREGTVSSGTLPSVGGVGVGVCPFAGGHFLVASGGTTKQRAFDLQ